MEPFTKSIKQVVNADINAMRQPRCAARLKFGVSSLDISFSSGVFEPKDFGPFFGTVDAERACVNQDLRGGHHRHTLA